jgi:hypothetical protein
MCATPPAASGRPDPVPDPHATDPQAFNNPAATRLRAALLF